MEALKFVCNAICALSLIGLAWLSIDAGNTTNFILCMIAIRLYSMD
jgi:hypothetical protein